MALTQLGKTWYDPQQVKSVILPEIANIQSRYDNKAQMKLLNEDVIIRNLRMKDIYIPASNTDSIHTIEAGEEYRPDVVAYNIYNNSLLGWVILAANNMKSIFEFKAGTMIRVPAIDSIYSNGGVLSNS